MFFTLTSPDGTLAQLVEQRTFNPFVVGSTPARPTKYWNKINSLQELLIFFRPKSIKVQSFILLRSVQDRKCSFKARTAVTFEASPPGQESLAVLTGNKQT